MPISSSFFPLFAVYFLYIIFFHFFLGFSFRYFFDIIMSLASATGHMEGYFSQDELQAVSEKFATPTLKASWISRVLVYLTAMKKGVGFDLTRSPEISTFISPKGFAQDKHLARDVFLASQLQPVHILSGKNTEATRAFLRLFARLVTSSQTPSSADVRRIVETLQSSSIEPKPAEIHPQAVPQSHTRISVPKNAMSIDHAGTSTARLSQPSLPSLVMSQSIRSEALSQSTKTIQTGLPWVMEPMVTSDFFHGDGVPPASVSTFTSAFPLENSKLISSYLDADSKVVSDGFGSGGAFNGKKTIEQDNDSGFENLGGFSQLVSTLKAVGVTVPSFDNYELENLDSAFPSLSVIAADETSAGEIQSSSRLKRTSTKIHRVGTSLSSLQTPPTNLGTSSGISRTLAIAHSQPTGSMALGLALRATEAVVSASQHFQELSTQVARDVDQQVSIAETYAHAEQENQKKTHEMANRKQETLIPLYHELGQAEIELQTVRDEIQETLLRIRRVDAEIAQILQTI